VTHHRLQLCDKRGNYNTIMIVTHPFITNASIALYRNNCHCVFFYFNCRKRSHYNIQLLSFENRLIRIKDNNNYLFNNLITPLPRPT